MTPRERVMALVLGTLVDGSVVEPSVAGGTRSMSTSGPVARSARVAAATPIRTTTAAAAAIARSVSSSVAATWCRF